MISSYFKRRFVLYVSFDFKKITDEHNAKVRFHDVGSFTNCRGQATELPLDFYLFAWNAVCFMEGGKKFNC